MSTLKQEREIEERMRKDSRFRTAVLKVAQRHAAPS